MTISNSKGLTLVELMIVLVLSSIIAGAVYAFYTTQQRIYHTQDQVADIQQRLRAAVYILKRDIRSIGFDPSTPKTAGMAAANANTFSFTRDDGNGTLETIAYSLYISDGVQKLGRRVDAGVNQPIAENIDALDFVYLDQNRNVTATLNAIRYIQVSIVARSNIQDPSYTNNTVYRNLQGTTIYTAPGDNLRRRQLSAEIECRNLGM